MSTTETSRYQIVTMPQGFSRWPYTLTDELYRPIDLFRTSSAAEYACRLLNQGNARINPHAVIGCRVEAR